MSKKEIIQHLTIKMYQLLRDFLLWNALYVYNSSLENSNLAAFKTDIFCGFGEIYHIFSSERLNTALQTSLLKPFWHRSHLQAQAKPQQDFSHRDIPSHMTAFSPPSPLPAAELSVHP